MLKAIRDRRPGLGRIALLVYLLTWFSMAVEPCVAAVQAPEAAHAAGDHAGHAMHGGHQHPGHGALEPPPADHAHCPTDDCVLADALPAPTKADTGSGLALPVLLALFSYPLFDAAEARASVPPLTFAAERIPRSDVLAFRVLLI